MTGAAAPPTIHATAVVVGESGVLIRGASGAGKSALAEALLVEAASRGLFARLVGDDRIRLVRAGGRVAARPHPAIAGLIERRGTGLVRVVSEPAAVLRLVVDLDASGADRMPRETDRMTELEGVTLPRMRLPTTQTPREQAHRVVDNLTLRER